MERVNADRLLYAEVLNIIEIFICIIRQTGAVEKALAPAKVCK